MSSPSRRCRGGLFLTAAALLCACDRPAPPAIPANTDCEFEAPTGSFQARLEQGPAPATERALPDNPGASSVLLAPAPRHRWASDVGLVETRDGSVLLHGVVQAPGDEPVDLRIVALLGYEPIDARLTTWTADRRTKTQSEKASHLRTQLDTPLAAFDIELAQGSVPVGTWHEVQTIISLGESAPDVRRWTVVAGPKPPPPVACIDGKPGITVAAGRSLLSASGEFRIVAPRAAHLGVVPVSGAGGTTHNPWFLNLDNGDGWTMSQPEGTDLVAVFDGPYAGPQKRWISNFWSASRSKAVSSAKVR